MMRNKIWLSLWLCALCMAGAASAEISLSGVVAAREERAIISGAGGVVESVFVRAGDWIEAGDAVAAVGLSGVYAPADGVARGISAQAGDNAGEKVLSIAPLSRYTVEADVSDAYDSAANRYVRVGEIVYMACASDGSHVAVGRIVSAEGSNYRVEVTGGELYMEETVYIYRDEAHTSAARIGSGKVSRAAEIAVGGTGRIAQMFVSEGDPVERGQLLFTCVEAQSAQSALEGGEILATQGGLVASVSVQAGQKLAAGAAVLRVYPREALCAELRVEEADLGQIAVGDALRLSFDFDAEGELAREGRVTEISYLGEETEAGAVYVAYVAFDLPDEARLGMAVTATLAGNE